RRDAFGALATHRIVRHEAAVAEGPEQLVEARQQGGLVEEHDDAVFAQVGLLGDAAGEAQARGLAGFIGYVENDPGRRQALTRATKRPRPQRVPARRSRNPSSSPLGRPVLPLAAPPW